MDLTLPHGSSSRPLARQRLDPSCAAASRERDVRVGGVRVGMQRGRSRDLACSATSCLWCSRARRAGAVACAHEPEQCVRVQSECSEL